ncbi:E3 ubiquitin-protein ligase RING2-like [Melanaphis sacchari]|uniref:RING-type E3 ubiquitin transferase n=1 Tax=Melanaphis sacchari TaxID=742174 RepID=A0A2H8TPV7_9HEMI|nr:E3 ubiquitin-protein ligase RING2-like [Melanaphis sacchari]
MASSNTSRLGKEWDLTPYELQRTPHEVITDDTEIAVPERSLEKELMCPICLDLLNKPVSTKCLHRFCSECIVTALRSGNKECPTCRKKIKSKRCLRPDPSFEMLISKIFPSREEYNAIQNRYIEKIKQNQSQDNLIKSIAEGIEIQSKRRSYQTKKKRDIQETESNSSSTFTPSTSGQMDVKLTKPTLEGNEIKKIKTVASTSVITDIIECDSAFNGMSLNDLELVLKPHPKKMRNNKLKKESNKTELRFLKAPPLTTVEHVSSYLTMRFNLDHNKEIGNNQIKASIYILQTAGQYILLEGNLTLQNVQEKFLNVKKEEPMEIFYSFN